jgi:hypothetical protein
VAPNEIQSRTLHRAAELAGGPEALARKFCIPEPALRMWLAGRPIPPEIFLRAVDIIVEHDIEAQKAAASQQRRQA